MAVHTGAEHTLPLRPIPDFLDETVRRFGERTGVDFLGRTWRWREIGRTVERVAVGLAALGVGKGTRVGLCLPNTPYYLIAYFAVLRLGGTVVNFNPLYVERELADQVRDSGTTIMVTLDLKMIFDKVEALHRKGLLERIVVCPMADILPFVKRWLFRLFKRGERASIPRDAAHVAFADLARSHGHPAPVAIDIHTDIAVLQYTGGTTGIPKAAVLTHANLCANAEQVRAAFPGARPGEERLLAVLPFFHVFGMTVLQNYSVASGTELVMLPRFELGMLFKAVARTRPTLLPGVPTLFAAVAGAHQAQTIDMTSIRYCFSGGAPLPAEIKAQFEGLTGCTLVEGYGLTEAAPVVSVNPLDGVNKIGSIGLPLVGTRVAVRDLDDGERLLDVGERGEIVVSGPQVMRGYWNRPGESEAVLRDGWLGTGDVGYIDEDGYIFLVDRIKDLIICSGFNVYPRVIEEALYRHADVAEATVIAVPDSYRGQVPKAFVRRVEGATVTEAELHEFLAGHLSKIEMPRTIEFRLVLPKTLVGKLSKKELVEEEAQRHADGAGSD